MSSDYTALALVVDRSGSMQSIQSDVIGSVKQFIGDQKKVPGRATLTVAQFDHIYEVLHDFKNIHEVDESTFSRTYTPRGSTALFDAIGCTALAMKQKIDRMAPADKPKKVVVAIITDGHENASREFTKDKIKALIKEQEIQGWDFMFMGATLDTIDVAKDMGFSADKAAFYSSSNFKSSMNVMNAQILNARLGKEVKISQAERDAMAEPNPETSKV